MTRLRINRVGFNEIGVGRLIARIKTNEKINTVINFLSGISILKLNIAEMINFLSFLFFCHKQRHWHTRTIFRS